MTVRPSNKIVISEEELRELKIDQVLEEQRNYASATVAPSEPKRRFRLIYATWFYLSLAGAVGALAAWSLIEPKFNDGIIFSGRISTVDPDAVPTAFRGTVYEIRGRLEVSGAEVYVFPGETRITGGPASQPVRVALSELKSGQTVTVQGEPAPNSSALLASVIRVEEDGTPPDAPVTISALETQQMVFGFLLFPLVAGLVGLTVGAAEGIICRTFARAAWCGGIGLIAGLLGGALSALIGGALFVLLGKVGAAANPLASGSAFLFLMFRRGLGWTIAGMTMGLGQGFALKSSQLKLNGFIGGMVGGLIGGLLFDPITLLVSNPDLLQGAELSRAIGLTVIGATVGLMIGLTELLTRDAWLKVVKGPLCGKEFTFNRTPIRLGSSPKNEIYLFKDPKIDPVHAEIHKLRDTFEIIDIGSSTGTLVNGQRLRRHRLTDGDRICIGDSEFTYSTREN